MILLIETSNAYARGLLSGVHRYVMQGRPWSLYLAEHSRQEASFSWLEGWRGDGMLARIETPGAAALVRRLRLPTVDLSAGRLVPNLPGVETDNLAIARVGVHHFVERGLRHLAFCGDSRFAWSESRRQHFLARALALGIEPRHFDVAPVSRAEQRDVLARWLRRLPKPVGVMASHDIVGQEVLEACHLADVGVPDEVAVLGVDNDEMIANLTSPPLSSVEPDTARTGFLAASMLDQMMDGIDVPAGLTLIEPLRLLARHSSDMLTVDDDLVGSAIRYIRDHAEQDVSVADVLHEVGLSRRALDIRFIRAINRTTHAEIVRARMAKVADLLTSTDLTLPRIAERLAFSHAEYMGVAFKRHTGRSPGQYRRFMTDSTHRLTTS